MMFKVELRPAEVDPHFKRNKMKIAVSEKLPSIFGVFSVGGEGARLNSPAKRSAFAYFFSNVYFSLILGQAPTTANLEMTRKQRLESNLML